MPLIKCNGPWDKTFDCLIEIIYDGRLVVEAFGLRCRKSPPQQRPVRCMYESEEQLAQDGLRFMKSNIAQRT